MKMYLTILLVLIAPLGCSNNPIDPQSDSEKLLEEVSVESEQSTVQKDSNNFTIDTNSNYQSLACPEPTPEPDPLIEPNPIPNPEPSAEPQFRSEPEPVPDPKPLPESEPQYGSNLTPDPEPSPKPKSQYGSDPTPIPGF